MPDPIRVLIVEDNPLDAELALLELRSAGFAPDWSRVDNEPDFLSALAQGPDLILSDYVLPQFDGLRALRLVREQGNPTPFIIVSGSIGEETAVAAMKEGATDYLLKDRMMRLGQSVRQVMESVRLARERRDADAALQASENRFRSVVETLPEVIWSATPDGRRRTLLSPAFESVWGRERAGFLGANDLGLLRTVCEEDRAVFLGAVAEQAAGRRTAVEYRIVRPDGSVRWIWDQAFPVHDADGRLVSVNGIASDITDRKNTERELRLRTAFFESQVESSPDGILVVDTHGRKILQNRRLAAIFGLPKEVAEDMDDGRQLREVTSRVRDPLAFAERVAWYYGNPDAIGREEVELVDGTVVDRYTAPVRNRHGGHYGRIWYFRDVTERHRLEQRLRQSQKMEAIGQLSAGVAHDFNNLLTIITSSTSLLQLTLGRDPSSSELLDAILEAAGRASGLTRQLLLFSRRQAMQAVDLDLVEVVTTMTRMLRRLLGEEITLVGESGPGPALVRADAGMIEQVLLNLAVNARDAMPRGGRLTLRTWRRNGATPGEDPCLADVPEGSWVCLSVADTGCGIPAANLPRLFEPFFTTKEVGKGTGLGLATVYGILQQHGGWIRVASSPGRGSTFHIGLPATEGPAKPPAPSRSGGSLLKGTGTLLVVEDEVPLRRIVEGALRRCGYSVLVAGSGREALGVWERHRDEIDLVLTDMVMPEGMSGGELVDRLRADKPDLAAIFTSGYSPEVVGGAVRFREGIDFLQKPFDIDSLSRLVSLRLRDR